MAKKKDSEPELTAAQLLEARVDAMMDPRPNSSPKPKPVVPPPIETTSVPATPDESGLPPLDIFAGGKTPSVAPVTEVPASEKQIPTAKTDTTSDNGPDDAKTDAAIDDIVAQEGDEALAAEDAGLADAAAVSPELVDQPAKGQKHHTIFWFIILLLVIVAGASAVLLTSSS